MEERRHRAPHRNCGWPGPKACFRCRHHPYGSSVALRRTEERHVQLHLHTQLEHERQIDRSKLTSNNQLTLNYLTLNYYEILLYYQRRFTYLEHLRQSHRAGFGGIGPNPQASRDRNLTLRSSDRITLDRRDEIHRL